MKGCSHRFSLAGIVVRATRAFHPNRAGTLDAAGRRACQTSDGSHCIAHHCIAQ